MAELTMDEWRAIPSAPDFRHNVTTYRDGWNGSTSTRTATFVGRCVRCARRTFTDTGGDDPRGPLGDHASAELDPAEYGATGAVVPACFLCQNDTEEKYTRTLRLAERHGDWRYLESAARIPECFQCGAPIRLRDGAAYAGWQHAGEPRFNRNNPHSAIEPRSEHEAFPGVGAANVACRKRYGHFSGSWCEYCGGWA